MSGISKVVYGGNTLIDLTSDSVSSSNLLSGETAHAANGDAVTGSALPLPSGGDADKPLVKNTSTSGDASWKTLPIAGGGTGATTDEDARLNLNVVKRNLLGNPEDGDTAARNHNGGSHFIKGDTSGICRAIGDIKAGDTFVNHTNYTTMPLISVMEQMLRNITLNINGNSRTATSTIYKDTLFYIGETLYKADETISSGSEITVYNCHSTSIYAELPIPLTTAQKNTLKGYLN